MMIVSVLVLVVVVLVGVGVSSAWARAGVVTQERTFSSGYKTYIASEGWRRRRRSCLKWTFGRDVIRPWLMATDVDHLHYRHFGHELPLLDIVPLHRSTHAFVTQARNMVGRGPVNAVLQGAFLVWLMPYFAVVALLVYGIHPWLLGLFHGVIQAVLHAV